MSQFIRCCIGVALASLGKATLATPYCVGTGNDLATAMETAAGDDQDDEIRIKAGVMRHVGAANLVARWDYYHPALPGTLTISGGWDGTCTTQINDPRLTELDAEYQGSAVRIFAGQGDIRISNLTITRGFNNGTTSLAGTAANLSIATQSGAAVTVERLIVVAANATSSAVAGGVSIGLLYNPATITLRNNLIAYNSGYANAGLEIAADSSTVVLTNNSIFSNSTANTSNTIYGVGVSLLHVNGSSYVANNVIVDNTIGTGASRDMDNKAGNTYLRNNHIGVLHATVAPTIDFNTTTGDPGWTKVGIYPIPNLTSPLRDSGYNTPLSGVGAVDLAGNPRMVDGTVDRGAIEAATDPDRIFADDFGP